MAVPKIWSGTSWDAPSGFDRPKVWNGSAWIPTQYKVWNGTAWIDVDGPNVTFSPDGGNTFETRTFYSDYSATGPVAYTITASDNVTWSYVRTGVGSASVANNGVASSITFTQVFGTTYRSGTWEVVASFSGFNKYWSVTLETEGEPIGPIDRQ